MPVSEATPIVPGDSSAPDWSARSEGIGVAVWTSFVVACIETMITFAFLDPLTLSADGVSASLVALRPALYGCGFFFLWGFAFIACGLTAYMLESGPHAPARPAAVVPPDERADPS